jgi:glycosyltransferase involved in cell wall biosynthesis
MEFSKKKILIFGPIGNFGGRELESGFIASVLSSKYEVAICSSGTITKNSQVFDFNKNLKVFSVKELLFDKYLDIKLLTYFSFFKNRFKGTISSYSNNAVIKRFFDYDKKVQIVLDELIKDYDLIFICAQLSSGLVSKVIDISEINGKKILFRTTGTIASIDYKFIDSVDCFIHHSVNNANKIEKDKCHNYVIIDQCAYNEEALLKIPLVENNISNFLVLSRLSPEKGIEEIIDFFLRVCFENDVLFIAGNGVLENDLKIKYPNSKNVKFQGFVNSYKLSRLFGEIDCLIIPSPEESGPLVGVESMCTGKVIISTRVGAMQERMKDTFNNYWFDYNNFESFKKVYFDVKSLNKKQIKKASVSLRYKYEKEYSMHKIGEKYLNILSKTLNL